MKKIFIVKAVCLILAVCVLGSVLTAFVACGDTKTTIPEKKAIIIVPGILAGTLYNEETGREIWDPFSKADNIDIMSFMGGGGGIGEGVNALMSAYGAGFISYAMGLVNDIMDDSDNYEGSLLNEMQVNKDGTSKNPAVTAVPWDYETRLRYGTFNAYRKLQTTLQEKYGDEYEVSVCNYDWRLDNRTAYATLENYINENNYTDVVLIGHSMGGIVCSGYIAKSAENAAKVDSFISIGTPFYGSLYALEYMENPYGLISSLLPLLESIGLTAESEKADLMYKNMALPMFQYMLTLYQLMPTGDIIDTLQYQQADGITSLLYVDGAPVDCSDLIATYKSRSWATDPTTGEYYYGVSSFGDFIDSQYVMKDGEKVHAALTVNSVFIAGDNLITAKALAVDDGVYAGKINDMHGDGTVPLYSAILGKSVNDEDVYIFDNVAHVALGCEYNEDIYNLIYNTIEGK